MEYGAGPFRVDVADRDLRAASSPRLVERYERYRLSQGRELLQLLPREGLRSVLAVAAQADAGGDSQPAGSASDLDRLARVCADHLPLPPYAVWLRDFHDNRHRYDADGSGVAAADLPKGASVTVDVRLFDHGPDEWVASLEILPVDTGWRGRIRFHCTDLDAVMHTAEIFREDLSTQVRERFLSTDANTLRAFLRSTLP